MDLVSLTSVGFTFSGLIVNGRLELPRIFLDIICTFFKKLNLNLHLQRLEIRFQSLENLYFSLVDFVTIKRLQIAQSNCKDDFIDLPLNLQLLTKQKKIKNKPFIVNREHSDSLLIIKRGENVYLNKEIWKSICRHKNCHQIVIFTGTQFSFEAMLIVEDEELGFLYTFYQMKSRLTNDPLSKKKHPILQ